MLNCCSVGGIKHKVVHFMNIRLLKSVPDKKEEELVDCAKSLMELLGNVSMSTRAAETLRTHSKRIRDELAQLQTVKGEDDAVVNTLVPRLFDDR